MKLLLERVNLSDVVFPLMTFLWVIVRSLLPHSVTCHPYFIKGEG